jgi:hypothetical protein
MTRPKLNALQLNFTIAFTALLLFASPIYLSYFRALSPSPHPLFLMLMWVHCSTGSRNSMFTQPIANIKSPLYTIISNAKLCFFTYLYLDSYQTLTFSLKHFNFFIEYLKYIFQNLFFFIMIRFFHLI